MKLAELLPQLTNHFAECGSRMSYRFKHQKAHQNSIAFGNMVFDSHSATLFPADQDVLSQHEAGNVLEPNGHGLALKSKSLTDTIDHDALRNSFYDFTTPTPALNQVKDEKSQYLMSIDVASLRIHNSQAIRVAIGGQTD